MKTEEINKIYDRLLEIKVGVESDPLPDPKQINAKIAQIHIFIDEVERQYIRVSKEIAIIQRTLNDETSEYEAKKEEIISNNTEVKELPSIRDREARANQMVKEDRQKIKQHENELNDLNNLLRAINLKLKNLNRANTDVRNQIRVMEANIRLGVSPVYDESAKSLQSELNKSMLNQDSFKNVETKVDQNIIVDPSNSINTNKLLEDYDESDEEIPDNYVEPVQEHGISDNDKPDDIDNKTIDEVKQNKKPDTINLDSMIDINQKEKGGESEKEEKPKSFEEQTKSSQKSKKSNIDIDELLSQFS